MLFFVFLCYSCSSPKPSQWPGASTGAGLAESITPPTMTPAVKRVQAITPELLTTFVAATDQPYFSQGHEPPNYLIQVLVNPEAVQQYRNWPAQVNLAPGTWLIARHSHRSNPPSNQKAIPLYTMFLETQGWVYGAITEEGWSVPVAAEACHDCHTQARAQSVFGLPVKHQDRSATAP